MTELEQLEKEEIELHELLSKNIERQRELNRIAFINKYKADIGDTVIWKEGYKNMSGIISQICFSGKEIHSYKAKLFNKDGNVGFRETRIWPSYLDTLHVLKKHKKD